MFEEQLGNEKRKRDEEEAARKKQDVGEADANDDKIEDDKIADDNEEEDEEEDEAESDGELEEAVIYNVMFINSITQEQIEADAACYCDTHPTIDLQHIHFQRQDDFNGAHWLLKAPLTTQCHF